METLNIVIAGAGMGGLTMALALRRAGHQVRIFERTRELAPIGAAISIWSNGVRVLNALGLKDKLDAISGDMQQMSYYDKSGKVLTDFSLEPLYAQVKERAHPVARALLQDMLLEAVGSDTVTLGVSCEQVEEHSEGVTITLSSGEKIAADLLVAADGTHSQLRNYVVGQTIQREYRGYVNWNGRVRIAPDLANAHEWRQFVGDHKRCSLMPMGNDEFYFFFDVPLPAGTENDRSQYRQELSQHFAGWAEPVQRLIERLDPARMARVEIHDVTPLGSLHRGRVVLIGDAAHAMTPDLGQGGCQAMEDAWVLTECLKTSGSLISALNAYDARRVERVGDIVLRARKRCDITHGTEPEKTRQWYDELANESGANILAGLKQTVDGCPLP
ncbi:FAD-dependent urate hydroxylase HpxO [Pokkaliibacter sp. CJK22405]|uniref:FAD-dependent urate hydroxylase HpxO n=1 Tax=Pokkaliibacter sp. CJK22405 TaxID=3384615 RepID=UPI0039852E41